MQVMLAPCAAYKSHNIRQTLGIAANHSQLNCSSSSSGRICLGWCLETLVTESEAAGIKATVQECTAKLLTWFEVTLYDITLRGVLW
jgi:hypothetical protein